MFVVTEAEASAIRAVYQQRGELLAAVELRQLFPGITDNGQARERARTIAGWQPLRPAKRLPKPPPGVSGEALRPAVIESGAHRVARLKERHRLRLHRHLPSGARIATGAGAALLYREGAEPAQLHPLAACERGGDLGEDRRHEQLDIRLPEMRIAGAEVGE